MLKDTHCALYKFEQIKNTTGKKGLLKLFDESQLNNDDYKVFSIHWKLTQHYAYANTCLCFPLNNESPNSSRILIGAVGRRLQLKNFIAQTLS